MKTVGIFIVISWVLRIVVMLAVVFIGFGAIAFIPDKSEPPSPDKAQYAIQTYSTDGSKMPSRIYFTNEIVFNSDTPIAKNYWWYDGEIYRQVKGGRVFTEPITVVRRKQ